MRPFKEVVFLTLAAMLGMVSAAYCTDIFGANATAELLKYGGLVCSGFLLAAQRLNTAAAAANQLDQFDALTREGFVAALLTFKIRFKRRLITGFIFSAIASTIGVILAEWETHEVGTQLIFSGIGGALLTASAVMVGGQLLAASWPLEFLSGALKIAEADKRRIENVTRYSSGEGFTN